MSAGGYFNRQAVVEGFDTNKSKAGGYTIGGQESVYPDVAEMANYKEPSYSKARTLAQAYQTDPETNRRVNDWTVQFENGLSRAADDWKPMNDGGFA
tara:strand:- start:560 stop:850 length:291 start_codon:yes stop_codon:yes gene_type:complete